MWNGSLSTKLEVLGRGCHVIAAVLLASLAACGGGGGRAAPATSPPTISNLAFAPTVAVAGSGAIAVNGTLDFSDSGGDVSTLLITLLDANGQQLSTVTAPIQGVAGQTSGTIAGSIQVATSTVGVFTFHVSVSDASGASSNQLSGTFQVVAAASQAALVAVTGPEPRSLTAAGGSVYWSESGEDALKSAPITGTSATVLATKMTNPLSMAFVGSDVLWLDDRGVAPGICSSASVNRVLKRTAANGSTRVLASGPACRGGAKEVVVIGGTVYWVSSTLTPDTWVINATPADGGTTTVATSSLVPIVALIGRDGALYWMENAFTTSSSAIRSLAGAGAAVATIASGFDSAADTFAVDANAVYYTTPNYPRVIPPFTETLVAQPLAGGTASTLSASISTPFKLSATGSSIVWLDAGALRSVPTGGGAVSLLASLSGTPRDLLFDGTNVLWTESSGTAQSVAGALRSIAPGGGPVTTHYEGSESPRQLAISPPALIHWIGGSADALSDGSARITRYFGGAAMQTVVVGIARDSAPFVVTATELLVADLKQLKRLPLGGGVPETVAQDDAPIANLASDGTFVYWNTAAGSIRRTPIAGGPVTVIVEQSALGAFAGTPGPIRIAPNGNLYWAAGSQNVLSAPSMGAAASPVPIAQGLPSISDLVVDNARVYVAVPTNGDIVTVPLAGGSTTTLAHVSASGGPIALALDDSTLFWFANLKVAQLPVAGGPGKEVLEFDSGLNAFGFAVDRDNVYFTQVSPPGIHRSAR